MSENGSACALDALLHRWNGSITSSSPGVTSLQHIQAIKAKSEAEQKRKEKKAEMARPTPPPPTWALLLLAHRSKKNGSLLVSLLQVMVPVVPS